MFAQFDLYFSSLVHLPSGRMLDVYTDMPCILVNTAQNFPNYGKMFFEEKVLEITDIAVPSANFGINGYEQTSSVSDEYRSTSNLELIPEDELNEDYAMDTSSLLSKQLSIHDQPIIGKSKTVYTKHSGICIRPQLFPDAVTHVSLLIKSFILFVNCLYFIP